MSLPSSASSGPSVDEPLGMDLDNGTGNFGSNIVTLEPYSSLIRDGPKKSPEKRNKKGGNFNINERKKMEILPGVYEIVNYEKFFILEIENVTVQNINVFKANREIVAVCGGQPKILPQGNGSLLIETSSPEQSEKLKKISKLVGNNVKCFPHPVFNQCRGVIYAPELLAIEEEEIQSELEDQGVVKVVRMKKRVGEQQTPLATLILTFNQCRLPSTIKAGWLSIKVKPYIPSPLRCYYCQMYGHLSQKCRNKLNEMPAVCSNCGKNEHGKCTETPSCIHCGEEHPATSKSCVKFIFEKEVQAIRVLEKVTFKEARKRAFSKQIRPGEPFSAVLKKQTPNIPEECLIPNSKPDHTRKSIKLNEEKKSSVGSNRLEIKAQNLEKQDQNQPKTSGATTECESNKTKEDNLRTDMKDLCKGGKKRERTPEETPNVIETNASSQTPTVVPRNVPKIQRKNNTRKK